MFTLFINSDPVDDLLLALIKGDNILEVVAFDGQVGLNEQLLMQIDKLLNNHDIKKEQLKLIAVKTGGGTFSSLRTAIATANSLGYALNIPVVPIDKSCNLDEVVKLCANSMINNFVAVTPIYDREPNITQAK